MNLSISDPPQELIDLLKRPKQSKKQIKNTPLRRPPQFSSSDIENMLAVLNPDMPYDDWLKIGMALHAGGYGVRFWDNWSCMGTKYKPGECEQKWQGFDGSGGVSLGTLVHMAEQEGFSFRYRNKRDVRTIDISPFKTHHWSKLHELPRRRYLVKGLLDLGALSVVYGPSNSGKTFCALDIACYVSLGWNWLSKNTKKGSVIYVAGEGGLGISERLEAFRLHHELDSYGDIYVIPEAVILAGDDDSTNRLLNSIQDVPNIKLIIIDTLARSMGSADENSAGDMGQFVKNCDDIRAKTNAHVMIIHHTGKDESKGARGSSALKAAIDTEIQISQNEGMITAEVKKQRDGKTGYAMHFELREYEVDKDEDGDPINSCVLIEADATEKKERLRGQAKQAYIALCNLIIDKATNYTPKPGMKPQKVVRLDDFKDHFFKAGISATDNPDSISKAFGRQKNSLKAKGYIAEWDGYVWITDKVDNTGQTITTKNAESDRQDTPL